MTVQHAREALAWRTRRGVNNLLAGFLLWTMLAVVSFFLDYPEQKAIAFLVGAVGLWPLALLAGWLLRLEPVPHDNPLGGLYLLICALQLPIYDEGLLTYKPLPDIIASAAVSIRARHLPWKASGYI